MMIKHFFTSLMVAATVLLAYAAVPSRLLFNPTSVAIDGYQVTVFRSFPSSPPFPQPFMRYVETVRPLEGGGICQDTNAPGFRYTNADSFGTWNIEEWAADCMTGDYHWSAAWTVLLWGVIPLRHVEIDTFIFRGASK